MSSNGEIYIQQRVLDLSGYVYILKTIEFPHCIRAPLHAYDAEKLKVIAQIPRVALQSSMNFPRMHLHVIPPNDMIDGMLFAGFIPNFGEQVTFGGHIFQLYETFFFADAKIEVYICNTQRCIGNMDVTSNEGHSKWTLRKVTFRKEKFFPGQIQHKASLFEVAVYHALLCNPVIKEDKCEIEPAMHREYRKMKDSFSIDLRRTNTSLALATLFLRGTIIGCPLYPNIPVKQNHPRLIQPQEDGLIYRMQLCHYSHLHDTHASGIFTRADDKEIHSDFIWKIRSCEHVIPSVFGTEGDCNSLNPVQNIFLWKFIGVPLETLLTLKKQETYRYRKNPRVLFKESSIRAKLARSRRNSAHSVAFIWKYVVGPGYIDHKQMVGKNNFALPSTENELLFYYNVITSKDILHIHEKRSNTLILKNSNLVRAIKQIKISRGTTYHSIATEMGISPATLSLWINGKSHVTDDVFDKILQWKNNFRVMN